MNLNSKIALTPIIFILLLAVVPINAQDKNPETVKKKIAILLFDNYETLDVFGPAELFGRLVDLYALNFYSLDGGLVSNRHNVQIMTKKITEIEKNPYIFLIPGGLGTRQEVENFKMIEIIKEISLSSEYVLTVCTGSALLAKTGLLDNKKATSNKRAFSWASAQSEQVGWNRKARWVIDGKYYTSSGVSAGMDMSLGFLADRHGIDFARKVAREIEYHWIEDKENDTFVAK